MSTSGPDLSRLFQPRAITLVGASPRMGGALQVIDNLSTGEHAIGVPIHVINFSAPVVAGIQAVASAEEIDGPLGVVYLMLGAKNSLAWLDSIGDRPVDAVVCYTGGFAETGDDESDLALRRWARRTGTPIVGPQSLGIIHVANRYVGMLVTLPERIVQGPVGVLCQSGGLVGGSVRTLLQRDVGIAAAVSYGSGTVVSFLDLASELIEDASVEILMIHTEAIPDFRQLRRLGRRAHQLGKPVLLTVAGRSEAGRTAVASHTGAVATPQRLAQGVCRQAGILWADEVDDLIDQVQGLVDAGLPSQLRPGVGIFSGSGGGAIAIADALDSVGVPLGPPTPETEQGMRSLGVTSAVNNPYDAGAALLDDHSSYGQQVKAYAADEGYGIICKVIGSSAPSRAMPPQLRQYEEFVDVVKSAGKLPFLATPITQDVQELVRWEGVPWAAGAHRAAVRLKALHDWGTFRDGEPKDAWWTMSDDVDADLSVPRVGTEAPRIISGPKVVGFLGDVPLRLAKAVMVDGRTDPDELLAQFDGQVILKAEAGLDHRALAGGVVGPIAETTELRVAMDFLVARFGYPISVNAFIAHDREMMVGVENFDGFGVFCSAGPGGVGAGAELVLHSAPMGTEEIRRFLAGSLGNDDEQLVAVVQALQDLPMRIPGFRSLEFNPLTFTASGDLVALDAKIMLDPDASVHS